MKSLMLAAAVVGMAAAECTWYNWTESDWPTGSEQNFEAIMSNKTLYLNSTDFEEGGTFYGLAWETVFWRKPTEYRPLGFRYAKLFAYNEAYPCFRVTGAGGHKVELMIYTFQEGASITVKDLAVTSFYTQEGGAVDDTASKRFYHCFTANTDTSSILEVAVICENNCMESDVDMLWRFRRSSMTWEDERYEQTGNIEMWCNMIAGQIEWPDEIQEGNPGSVSDTNNDNLDNSSSSISLFAVMAAGLIAMAFGQ